MAELTQIDEYRPQVTPLMYRVTNCLQRQDEGCLRETTTWTDFAQVHKIAKVVNTRLGKRRSGAAVDSSWRVTSTVNLNGDGVTFVTRIDVRYDAVYEKSRAVEVVRLVDADRGLRVENLNVDSPAMFPEAH